MALDVVAKAVVIFALQILKKKAESGTAAAGGGGRRRQDGRETEKCGRVESVVCVDGRCSVAGWWCGRPTKIQKRSGSPFNFTAVSSSSQNITTPIFSDFRIVSSLLRYASC